VSFVEADGPGFESFRIAVLFGLSGVTFVVTEDEVFSWREGPRIKSIRGSALNLSPLARLLRHDQLVPVISFPVFIRGREMITLFRGRVDNPILQVKIGLVLNFGFQQGVIWGVS
jgi:hypothetical protein